MVMLLLLLLLLICIELNIICREQGEITVNMLCERRKSKEGKEGMDCFFTKKKPSWV